MRAQYATAQDTGNSDARRAAAEAITRQYPDIADGFVKLAETLLALRLYQEAVNFLDDATTRFPDDVVLPYFMGHALVKLRQHLRAEPFFRRAATLQPKWADANFRLGHCLARAGSFAESVEYLKRAAAIQPGSFDYRATYASSLIALDRFDEARVELEAALSIDPSRDDLRRTLEDIKGDGPKSAGKGPRIKRSKWPPSVAAFSDLRSAIRQYIVNDYDTRGFVLKPGMAVLTQGSCFARNLKESFARYPLTAGCVPLGEEHNSPFTNAVILRWLVDGAVDDETRVAEGNFGADMRPVYRKILAQADLYVYTMGVAPVFFDSKTGRFQMPRADATNAIRLARNCVFRTTTVAENVEQLTYIVNAVKRINPNIMTVITVSPIPLNNTLEMPSAILADCLSKSTLRVAAHEVSQASGGAVQYWPSFEIVRWLASHRGAAFGGDDGSSFHVNSEMVEAIVDSFVDVFGAPELRAGRKAESQTMQAD